MLIYPRDQAREVLRFYRDFSSHSPDELTSAAALATSPEGQPITLIALCYSGPIEEGERVLEPLRQFGPPAADLIGPKTYLEIQSMLDPAAFPHGIERYWKSGFLKQVDDQLIDLVVDRSTALNPLSFILFFHFRGAAGRVSPGETAFGLRADQWDFDIISQWTDPAEAEQWVRWTRAFWGSVEPFTTGGVYVNHLSSDDAEQRVKSAFGPNYERLVAVKNKYDPKNLFRVNHNIKPTV
jgi:FAD/FMN-containing dehydrogenase